MGLGRSPILWDVFFMKADSFPVLLKSSWFNITLNNHRKDVKDPKAILADKHF